MKTITIGNIQHQVQEVDGHGEVVELDGYLFQTEQMCGIALLSEHDVTGEVRPSDIDGEFVQFGDGGDMLEGHFNDLKFCEVTDLFTIDPCAHKACAARGWSL